MDITNQHQRIISICTGIRGLETGLELAGVTVQPIVFIETEAVLIANLVTGIETGVLDPTPIWTDVKTFDPKPFRGKIHGITAGYPCQPWSNAGQRKGKEDPRHLFPYICRILEEVRPIWCLFENVRGHISLGYGEVYRSLRDLGYAVEPGIYTAEEVGAPHERERLFILAVERSERGRLWVREMADSHSINGRLPEPGGRHNSIQITGSGETVANTNGNGSGDSAGNSDGTSEAAESAQHGQEWHEIFGEWLRNGIGDSNSTLVNAPVITEREQTDKTNAKSTTGQTWPESGQRCEQLADSEDIRMEGNGAEGEQKPCAPVGEKISGCNSRRNQWPARPGEQQYEWESPRSVITKESARLLGGYGKKYPESFQKWQIEQVAFDDFTGSIKPSLGLSTSRYDFREDFLRACGNAVVPEQAAIAFINLLNKHKKNLGADYKG